MAAPSTLVSLDLDRPVWDRFHTVAPLVVVGTREPDGTFDLAPKHLAMPMGWEPYFGFVCTPRHATYRNARREGVFTVSYPRPNQVVLASLAAAPRCEDGAKQSLDALPTFPATEVEGVFLEDAYLFLECRLHRVFDGFGVNSLITGTVEAAYVREEALRAPDVDDHAALGAAPLLAYLPPGRYACVRETYAFPFPAGFSR